MFAQEQRTKEILALSKLIQVITRHKDWLVKNRGEDLYEERNERKLQRDGRTALKVIQDVTRHDGGKSFKNMVSSFLEDLNRNALTLNVKDDGSYTLLNPDGSIHKEGFM